MVKLINEKIMEFKTNFAGKDMQDYIAMALIWFATEQTKTSSHTVEKEVAASRLNSIEKLLDSFLIK